MKRIWLSAALALTAGAVLAEPVTYEIDPSHTYPSFEADHMGGLSIWRGKFNATSGRIVLDREARAGTVEVTVDMTSIDFGHEEMNAHAKSADMFDVEKYPTATYKGRFSRFEGDVPVEVQGELTMHGVTRPVTLTIHQFLCKQHPMHKREVCGADASATIDRSEFGVSYGQSFGFKQDVKLLIQVEALRAE